jgi:hypothetical protein
MWRQNGDKDLSRILTFYRSYMAVYFGASKFKEGRSRECIVCLSGSAILCLLHQDYASTIFLKFNMVFVRIV